MSIEKSSILQGARFHTMEYEGLLNRQIQDVARIAPHMAPKLTFGFVRQANFWVREASNFFDERLPYSVNRGMWHIRSTAVHG